MGLINRKTLRKWSVLIPIFLLIGFFYTNCGRSFEAQDFAFPSTDSVDQLSSADLTILSQPSALIATGTAEITFKFTTEGSGVTLKCYQNSVEIPNCRSPLKFTNLQDGDYNILFIAEAAGNMGPLQKTIAERSVQFKVDSTPPLVSLVAPPSVIDKDFIAIQFTASDSGSGVASVQCSLDSGAFENCTSPKSLNQLAEGNHQFQVRVKDQAGHEVTSQAATFSVSTTEDPPPQLAWTQNPTMLTKETTASFLFSATSTSGIQSTQCQLDNAAFENCSSPKNYSGLGQGAHTFVVKVTDTKGVLNSLSHTWTVDTTPPSKPQLSSNVMSPTKLTGLNLSFSANDASGIQQYTCRQNNGSYSACTSPKSITGLTDGTHTFYVKAEDKAGNLSTEASLQVLVDLKPPVITVTKKPSSVTNEAQAAFQFSVNDNNGSGVANITCQFNQMAATSCTNSASYTVTQSGVEQTLTIKATDKVGHIATEVYRWTYTKDSGVSGLINVAQATPENGFNYIVAQDFGTPGDSVSNMNQSILRIFENGVELGPAHALHREIRDIGKGRFSHWGNSLYFSTSDNSDPRTNGRVYTYALGDGQTPNPDPEPDPDPQPNPGGPLAAFSGAQGGGAGAVGGRGGKIIEVTNLNDSGTGSLRACLQASGARTCVFRVGGTINLLSEIEIKNPYVTVAGQTAPGGGILLRGSTMAKGNRSIILVRTHNVIFRYMRLRFGDNNQGTEGGVNFEIWGNSGQNISNIIIDHVSFSWGTDENFSMWSQGAHFKNITLSNNIFAEGLKKHASKGAIIGSHVASARENMKALDIHHSLFIHNNARNPYVGVKEQAVINNLIYNWGVETGIAMRGGLAVDIIGNVMKPGRDSDHGSNPDDMSWYPYDSSGCNKSEYCISGNPSIFVQGNVVYPRDVRSNPDSDNWPHVQGWTSSQGSYSLPTSYRRTTPLSTSSPLAHPIKVSHVDKDKLEDQVLAEVGASRRLDCNGNWVPNRDSVDSRLINDYKNGTGRIPSTESDVGGFPSIANGTPCADQDKDGMPDQWEIMHGFNPNNAADGNQDADGDGYTNVEEYLNGTNPKAAAP